MIASETPVWSWNILNSPFFQEEIEFPGNNVSKEEVSTLTKKVDYVWQMDSPKSSRDFQVFLVMVGYYKQSIPHFSELSKPLVHLFQNESPNVWNLEQENAFHVPCEALSSSLVLIHPNFEQLFIFFINASDVAIGAILSQQDSNLADHPEAYYNKIFSRA